MTPPRHMTPAAKRALAATIRELRGRLLADLHDATESAYRLSVRARDAGLDEAARARRARLEAWIAEQLRAQAAGQATAAKPARSFDDLRREAEARAASTLLNRLVLLRLMEAPGPPDPDAPSPSDPTAPARPPLRAPAVVTGGFQSRAYQDLRALAPALCQGGRDDATEGYAFLLRLVFDDLATELPGLYGPAGVADLVPVPAATLRHVVDALDDPDLASCWTDDMTLGWVYQYWNDPAREALDAKLNAGGKVAPHEIASKTQMFTERYMVDWLLQNTLGPMWLAICARHKWTPDVARDGTLDALEARRAAWRAQREAGEVDATALMPLHTDAERRWAYFLPQPVPQPAAIPPGAANAAAGGSAEGAGGLNDAIASAPQSLRDLRLIDPAVGSGHFLVVALSLLVPLYREEARHRGESDTEDHPRWSDRAIVERILSHNLHGVDLDPRAVQIAAAALWLKAQHLAPGARPERLNLVAADLRLSRLPDDDPALVELRREVEREAGLPAALTDTLVHALRGADHLGSLLKIDRAVDDALDRHERGRATQGELFAAGSGNPVGSSEENLAQSRQGAKGRDLARATILSRLEAFLGRHTHGDDLGLRLRGEQLAAGVRFVRLMREGTYDLVVANPPYQGTSKMADSRYVERHYPLGKADLFAAFLLRGLELVREGGVSAMLTMRNWMFIKQYSALRQHLLGTYDLRALHDLSSGAFEEISAAQVVVSVATSVFSRVTGGSVATAIKSFDDETVTQVGETDRKRAATLCHVGRHTFDPAALKVVPEWPLVYWWDEEMLRAYQSAPLIGDVAPARQGLITGDMTRFLRSPSEVTLQKPQSTKWQPYVMGAKGKSWVEPLDAVVEWRHAGLEVQSLEANGRQASRPQNQRMYFQRGVAFSMIGASFTARVHRYPSIFGDKGSSVFPERLAGAVCAMNSARARTILESLNPSVSFQVGDVNRLPLFPIADADAIFAQVEAAFGVHEAHREPSVEFKRPGPSPWRHAQDWAQLAVDRPQHPTPAPLPEYVEVLDAEPASDHLSFALGVALGRFGPLTTDGRGQGVLDPATADLSHALPEGILFLDTTLDAHDLRDGLGAPGSAPLHTAWEAHGADVSAKRGLREWLAWDLFKDVHRAMYENRPIHWPLSSPGKLYVAWVNIHRMSDRTLNVLLADHLVPTRTRLEGELADLRAARDGADKKAAREAERRLEKLSKALADLEAFIASVAQCADRGAPQAHDKKAARCPAREVDARYAPDLDDGVMINAAGLWPLLDPQWKDPKKWWKELSEAKGRKDYDWSHLARRYWPTRVDAKCQKDPSLAVAHGCFWRYHPERAWSWELRLQDEIGPDFRITEAAYEPWAHTGSQAGDAVGKHLGDGGDGPHREAFLRDHPEAAIAGVEKEAIRRMGRGKKKRLVTEVALLEEGLWSGHPGTMWELELSLSERQGAEVRILAPDEPEARATFEGQNPNRVRSRAQLLAGLVPPADLFDADDEDDDDAPDDTPEDEDDDP